jgi:hypothetical protein
MSTLNAITIARAHVSLPAWGVWYADVELTEPTALDGAAQLEFPGLSLAGTIVSGGPYQGRARYRVAGGKGAWGKAVKAKPYANDAGVKIATALTDAAKDCGETLVGDLPKGRVGPHYARRSAPASNVLNILCARDWYVDDEGNTRIGKRSRVEYSGSAEVLSIDTQLRVVRLGCETLAGLRPGVVVSGVQASDVVITQDPKRIRATVYGMQSSRTLAAFERLLTSLFPDLVYRGAFEYRVVTQSGDRLNLQPALVSTGLPDLSRVPMRPGVAGARNDVKLGSLVVVQFLNADPGRPVVTGFDAPDSPGWLPSATELQIGGLPGSAVSLAEMGPVVPSPMGLINGVARLNDDVIAGPFAGKVVRASMKVRAG